MSSIRFGTDGWRAVIAEDFTFDNVARVAQAAADYWMPPMTRPDPGTIVVGYDRRFLSDQFAAVAAEIFCGSGFHVVLTSVPTPTPAVSYAVKSLGAQGGVMITASHNPAIFNGFKLKAHYGGSADSRICAEIEKRIDRHSVARVPLREAIASKQIVVRDLRLPHYRAIKQLVNLPLISRAKLRFAHDALFGVGAGCFEDLLGRSQCTITTLNGAHDPFFGGINPEPIEANYGPSAAYLRKHPHDFCLVTDGDADRVGGMDGVGRALSTHQIIALLLFHCVVNRKGKGRVVKALTTTSLVDKMCRQYGLPLVETGVGFKYICAEMLRGDVLLGAEESGGIAFAGHIPERDGILAGMMLLELLATDHRTIGQLLKQLERDFGPHHYARWDTRFPVEKRAALMEYCQAHPPTRLLRSPVNEMKTYDGVKYIANDGSWLMLRGSGTEPIVRVYAEAPTRAAAEGLVRTGARMLEKVA